MFGVKGLDRRLTAWQEHFTYEISRLWQYQPELAPKPMVSALAATVESQRLQIADLRTSLVVHADVDAAVVRAMEAQQQRIAVLEESVSRLNRMALQGALSPKESGKPAKKVKR